MEKVRSADGTMIAFDHSGRGPALILVVGAFSDRSSTKTMMPLHQSCVDLQSCIGAFSVPEIEQRQSLTTTICALLAISIAPRIRPAAARMAAFRTLQLVGRRGLEPRTSALSARRSAS